MKVGFITGSILAIITSHAGCSGHTQHTGDSGTEQQTQSGRVGGECEAGYCDLIYKGMPEEINSVDTSAGWYEKGEKLMVTGTVFKADGKTPAPDVIVYYHHTDNNGYYSPGNDKPEDQTRHGHIRGWVKTDEKGNYTIYTIRPAPYPGREFPAHIHWLIKEPAIKNEYWVEDLVFDDDNCCFLSVKVIRQETGVAAVSFTSFLKMACRLPNTILFLD